MIEIELDQAVIKLPDFSDYEFDCNCGCGLNNMKPMFLWKLQQARTEAQITFNIISGSRCKKHNKSEGGKPKSDHITGEGADIEALDSRTRWKIITAGIRAGFRRIGVGKTFVHLGDNWQNPQCVIWPY